MQLDRKTIGAATISAILLTLSFPGGGSLWPLAWIALVPLLSIIRQSRTSHAAMAGFAVGCIHYLILLHWITIVLTTYGHLSWWISWPALLLLVFYMSLYHGLFTGLIAWVYAGRKMPLLWAGPALWVVMDVIRANLFSGLPWMDLAYSQYRVPFLLQTADITGHLGVTFHIVLFNCLIVDAVTLFRERKTIVAQPRRLYIGTILTAVFILASVTGYNIYRAELSPGGTVAGTIPVVVVQGNIAQDQKWIPAMQAATIRTYDRLTDLGLKNGNPHSQPLVIWPETALPFFQTSPLFTYLAEEMVVDRHLWLLTGLPYRDRDRGAAPGDIHYYNTSLLIAPTGTVAGRYDKQHLVPFGEYIPLKQFLPLPGPLVESIGDFSPGTSATPIACQDARIGILICFESIFPAIARQQAAAGANLLVNQTNDAWFGRSSAPVQHLSMAVLRAIETRKTLVRAANTGISAIIKQSGSIHSATPLFEEAALTAEVELLSGQTIFVRFGYLFGYLCMLIAVVGMAGVRYFNNLVQKAGQEKH